MTYCSTAAPAPLQCPPLEQSIEATAQLWPRGRAWPVNSRAMIPNFLAWLATLVGVPAPSNWPAGFVQAGFTAAIGAVRNFLETQLCALRLEFWCATQTLTNDLWMAEYGLPDGCEPFPNLCQKVAAQGGARCEFYQEITAALGWTITCSDFVTCSPMAQAGCMQAGCARASGMQRNVLLITVYLEASPAYKGGFQTQPMAGQLRPGLPLACPPDITPLQCLMERIAHAHVVVVYQIVS